MFAAALVAGLLAATTAAPLGGCGYQSCPVADADVLNVHIVPHTHDDVGWLKTVDQYYYGSLNSIQQAGVQYILDSVVDELWKDPSRRFIYVETAFFWKWWQRQLDGVRHKVHTLVRQGRLEFIGGAWSMNDEADTHYQTTIDQFTWGLRKLNDTFGECGRPRVGWQIDPFGHSREFASLLASMGYDGLFHGRIDYQDKRTRLQNRTMEMLWRGSDDLGSTSDLFTGVLYNTYSPPSGFCFDVLCTDDPIVEDPESPMFNVESKVSRFLDFATRQRRHYRTNNVLLTMGGDFTYQHAGMWYKNLDVLIKYANQKSVQYKKNIKLFYSTPSCYLKAVHDSKPKLPTKQDDFFPYASDPHAYWTGYFTSRPTIKYFERRGNAYLQMVKQLQVLAHLADHNSFLIDDLKGAMGIMQHHDAVTGTEKQHVADDYARLLDRAIEDGLFVAQQALSKLMERAPQQLTNLPFVRCQFNISQCVVSETEKRFIVTVYNPLTWNMSAAVRVPVINLNYNVYNDKGEVLESQMMDVPPPLVEVPTRHSSATRELVFIAHAVPGLGYRSYYIQRADTGRKRSRRSYQIRDGGLSYHDKMAINVISNYIANNYKNDATKEKRMFPVPSGKQYDLMDYFNMEPVDVETTTEKDDNFDMNDLQSAEIKLMLDKNEMSLKEFEQSHKEQPTTPSDIPTSPSNIPTTPSNIPTTPSDIPTTPSEYNIVLDLTTIDKENTTVAFTEATDDETPRDKDRLKYLSLSTLFKELPLTSQTVQIFSEEDFIQNEHMKLSIDKRTGELTTLALADGTSISFDIDMLYYKGWIGDNQAEVKRSSGAYIFRPNGTRAIPMSVRNNTKIVKGKIVQEIHQEYSDFASTVIRLYKNSEVLEVEWLVGPIPILDNIGKEVIIRYQTNLSNNEVFYTDSNGRQSLKRILNRRPQYKADVQEVIAGNYYPVNSKIYIEDLSEKVRFSVLNDRAQGGSSLADGQIELMVHRRLLHDDAFGVGEALNETAEGYGLVARGKHYIHVGKINAKTKQFEKTTAVEILQPLEVLVSNATNMSLDDWKWLRNEWTALKSNLPKGIHLLTLEPWRPGLILLRLENIFQKEDYEGADDKVTVDLQKLFNFLGLNSITEVSLAANQLWKDRQRFDWAKENEFTTNFNDDFGSDDNSTRHDKTKEREAATDFVVELKASEIRSFVIRYCKQKLNVQPRLKEGLY